jgi:CRP/FNR family transcriptional regulator, cyclic AMP receptor protein
MSKNVPVSTLKDIQFLNVLPPRFLEEIAGISRFRDFKSGDFVFHEGDAAKSMYLIVSGSVSLKICAGGMGSKQVVTLGAGEMLGWSSLTNHPEFAATAVANGPTRLVEIDGTRLHALCDADQEFGYELLRRTLQALSKRLIATWTQLADVYVPHYAPVTVGAAARNE